MEDKGFFVVVEGVDRSGKDTLIRGISSHFFSSLNFPERQNFFITFEPTIHSKEGLEIRQNKEYLSLLPMDPKYLASLYIKDRLHHSELITSLLEKKVFVLCSRYDLSTYTYQGNMGSDFDSLYQEHDYGNKTLIPDLTLFLDASPKNIFERLDADKDAPIDGYHQNKDLLLKVIFSYKEVISKIKERQPSRRILIIDANEDPKAILQKALLEIHLLLNSH